MLSEKLYTIITGIILSGGKSSRMGADKAFLSFGDKSVIEILIKLMKKIFKTVFIITNAPSNYKFPGILVYEDIIKNKGPLSGIHSGLFYSTTGKNFIISCDIPLISEEMIRHIIEFKSDKPIKYCAVSGKHHYLAGCYSKSLISEIEKIFRLKESSQTGKGKLYSIKNLIERVDAEVINPEGLSFFNNDLFFNLNTKDDFDYLKKKKMKKLLIFSGPVKSGKSSKLFSFIETNKNAGGILSLLIDGKKYLYDIHSQEKRLLEAEPEDSEKEIINVGRYSFKKKVFKWGNEILRKARGEKYSYLIIDEVGPLELAGEGLSSAADDILKNFYDYSPAIIVVVRESLIKKILTHYKLNDREIEYFSI
jgi:molybdopterin-guanine dinucleotide biosynthesis protein A